MSKPKESAANPPPSSGLDDLLDRLRRRVADRRASGQYPENLEENLSAHFQRIVHHRPTSDSRQHLRSDVEAIESHSNFTRARIALNSGVPGGVYLHRVINKAVSRQTQGVLEQSQEFADAVRRAMQTLADVVEEHSGQISGELVGRLEAIVERLDSYETASAGPSDVVLGDLQRRIASLERAEAARGFKPWFKYEDFEDEVGRSRESLLAIYRPTAALMAGMGPVLDIGCGRGEFIELLEEIGVEGRGVEIDPKQAQEARDRGFEVVTGDGLEMLANSEDGSLGGIVLLQVAEHLTAQQLMDLARISYDKLRPGGRMLVETPNPLSLFVHAYGMFLDPTHDHLVHPIYARFLFLQAGFKEVGIEWRSEPPEQERLMPVDDDPDSEANRNVERLNRLLYAHQDYLLIILR